MECNNTVEVEQLEIIKKYNPCYNEQHAWIRMVGDIKTFEETFLESDYVGSDEFYPDYSRANAEEALQTGYITVFNSHPIEQGIFVTT